VHVYQGKFGENEKPRPYMFVMLQKVPLQLHVTLLMLALSSTVDVGETSDLTAEISVDLPI
jgi:hypothetical protein